jgi:hypothetical protein
MRSPVLVAVRLLLAAVAASSAAPAALLGAGPPPLADTLRRAGEWIDRFRAESIAIVAAEEYVQQYRHRAGSGWGEQRRTLVSDVALVQTPVEEARAGYPWVQYRDVLEVDGRPLPDHADRLDRLLADLSASSYARASALTAESARYNIGPGTRTVNVPLFALFFLVPANQHRFTFDSKGEETLDATRVAVVGYRERERPTMIRSPEGAARPARGRFWIDPASGRVLKTRLEADAGRQWAMTAEVTFGQDAHVEAWVALSMVERYRGNGDDSLDCTARYSNFRRFSTSARVIVR